MNDPYRILPRDGVFACVNSGDGFLSYFDRFLENCSYVFAIKGGPGTGKSGLMKKAAEEAEKRGEEILKIYCSSDPDSLDGVIFKNRGAAFIDATSPHVYEPAYPGVSGEIVNAGAFWNGAVLHQRREEILDLNRQKSAAYARTFDALKAANRIKNAQISQLKSCVRESAFEKALRRFSSDAGKSKSGGSAPFPAAGIGMAGWVRLNTDIQKSEKIVTFLPFYGAENLFLAALARYLDGARVHLSADPVSLLPDSLFLPDAALLLRCGAPLCDAREKVVRTAVYFPAPEDDRRALRAREETLLGCMLLAQRELQTVKKHHFALEAIYGSAMDFDSLNEFTERLIGKVFT